MGHLRTIRRGWLGGIGRICREGNGLFLKWDYLLLKGSYTRIHLQEHLDHSIFAWFVDEFRLPLPLSSWGEGVQTRARRVCRDCTLTGGDLPFRLGLIHCRHTPSHADRRPCGARVLIQRLICTIITKSYLAHARVLAKSIREHNPELPPLLVLLADRVDGFFDPATEPFQMIQLEDLAEREVVRHMSFYYTPFEYCCALRGLLHEYILTHTRAHSWVFLDTDILVCNSLEPLFQALQNASVLLSPHLLQPSNAEPASPFETNLLRCGVFNAGMLGLSRCETVKQFIDWFKKRLMRWGFHDFRSCFVDQLWLNLAPFYFSDVQVFQHPGCNVGYWNTNERFISVGPVGSFKSNGQPLLFFHFSGWDIDTPWKVSRHSTKDCSTEESAWFLLSHIYREMLLENSYYEVREWPYAFDHFENGDFITTAMRRAYYDEIYTTNASKESPFTCPRSFRFYQSHIRRWWHIRSAVNKVMSKIALTYAKY